MSQSDAAIYAEWIAGLTDEEKATLSPDLLQYEDDGGRVSGHMNEEHDPAEMAVGDLNEHEGDASDLQRLKYEIIDRLLSGLLDSPNMRLSALGLCYALNLPAIAGLGTMKQAATKYGTTKASISKAALRWVDILDLEHYKSPHTQSKARRDTCRKAQEKSHWRKSTYTTKKKTR